MDAKAKKALVDTLSDAKNFDTLYPDRSRRWFVDMAIRAFEAQSMSDVQIETKTIELIVKATRIVMAKRDFSIGVERGQVAGQDPAQAAGRDPLRRDREPTGVRGDGERRPARVGRPPAAARGHADGLLRQPEPQGYFRYPKTCQTNEKWRLNVDAQAFWKESPRLSRGPVPLPR